MSEVKKTLWKKSAVKAIVLLNEQRQDYLWKIISPNIYFLNNHIDFIMFDGKDLILHLYSLKICSDLIDFIMVNCSIFMANLSHYFYIDKALIYRWVTVSIDKLLANFITGSFQTLTMLLLNHLRDVFDCKNDKIIFTVAYYTKICELLPLQRIMNIIVRIEEIEIELYFDKNTVKQLRTELGLEHIKNARNISRMFIYLILILLDERNCINSKFQTRITNDKDVNILLNNPFIVIASNVYIV